MIVVSRVEVPTTSTCQAGHWLLVGTDIWSNGAGIRLLEAVEWDEIFLIREIKDIAIINNGLSVLSRF